MTEKNPETLILCDVQNTLWVRLPRDSNGMSSGKGVNTYLAGLIRDLQQDYNCRAALMTSLDFEALSGADICQLSEVADATHIPDIIFSDYHCRMDNGRVVPVSRGIFVKSLHRAYDNLSDVYGLEKSRMHLIDDTFENRKVAKNAGCQVWNPDVFNTFSEGAKELTRQIRWNEDPDHAALEQRAANLKNRILKIS